MQGNSYYDPKTDTIENAMPGTYAWEHEQRHREQYQKGIAQKVDKLQVFGYYCGMTVMLFGWIHHFISGTGWVVLGIGLLATIGLGYLPFTLGMVYLEADAHLMGWQRYRRNRL